MTEEDTQNQPPASTCTYLYTYEHICYMFIQKHWKYRSSNWWLQVCLMLVYIWNWLDSLSLIPGKYCRLQRCFSLPWILWLSCELVYLLSQTSGWICGLQTKAHSRPCPGCLTALRRFTHGSFCLRPLDPLDYLHISLSQPKCHPSPFVSHTKHSV